MMLFGFGESSWVFGPGGSFFCGMNGGRDERTDSLPAGRLHGRAWCGRFAGSD